MFLLSFKLSTRVGQTRIPMQEVEVDEVDELRGRRPVPHRLHPAAVMVLFLVRQGSTQALTSEPRKPSFTWKYDDRWIVGLSGREGGADEQGIGDEGRRRPLAQRRRIFRPLHRGPDLDELRLKPVEQKSRPFRSLVTPDSDFSSPLGDSQIHPYYALPARCPAANPHQARGRRRMMKRGSADDDDKATTRSGTHKRRRQLQPLPARGSPEPPPRSNAIDRVSAWLDCLPESPRSLASSDAVDKPQDKTIFDPPSSLSSNPNKPRSQNYRAQVLRRLEIRVDADADDDARQRLLPPIQDGGLNEERIGEVARELYESARELLERAAVNDEWTAPLSRAIQSLMRDTPDQLCCLPDREWQPALKPVTYIHRIAPSPPSLPQKHSSTTLAASSPHPEPASSRNNNNLGYPTPDQTQSPVQSQPATNPPPLAPPRTPFLHLEPAPARLQPKTPCPDLSVGLSDSDTAWTTDEKSWTRPGLGGRDVKDILVDLQHAAHEDRMTLITDPCVASPSGLRFPFLIVEATPGANASIADAENNAAVAAACALRILAELSSPERAAAVKKSSSEPSPPTAEQAEASNVNMRCFSLTTDGPMHVLWVHTPAGNGSHMVWLGAYRVTHHASALDLVRKLARILHWGAGDLRDWVRHQCVQYIDRILSG